MEIKLYKYTYQQLIQNTLYQGRWKQVGKEGICPPNIFIWEKTFGTTGQLNISTCPLEF